jgi:O-antigen/teichoic acid export membrane protein
VAQRIGMIPAAVIGIAVGQVFYGELSARLRAGERDNKRLFLKASGHLMLIGTAVAIGLLALPPLVFPLILGSQWGGAAAFAQAMAPSIGLGFMVGPLSFVFDAYLRGATQLALDISRVALVGGLGYLAHRGGWSAVNTTWAMYAGQLANHALTWVAALAIVSGTGAASTISQTDDSAVIRP